jgi:cysteine desulfurase
MKRAYFDHNATTPVDPAVVDAMIPYLREQWGNASSVHEWGKEARYGVEKARRQVANLAQVPEDNLIFTSCGTESNNTVLVSVAKRFASEGCHIITSSIEHPAIYRCLGRLESEGLAEVTYLNPERNGMVDPGKVEGAIRTNTRLISIMWANNETGALQPIEEIARLARKRGIFTHSDTIQALGKVSLDLEGAGLDFASFSAHKLYGPKGVGALYFKDRETILPLLQGGGQEMKLRPGTENVAGAVGFGTAAALSAAAVDEEPERLRALRTRLENRLTTELEGTYVCAEEASRLPGTLCVCFERVYGTYVVLDLADEGIAVSSGSACSANKSEPSHVLLAMGIEAQLAQGAVRYSLGRRTTQEEVDLVAEATIRIVEKQRAHPPFQEEELDLLSICD